MKKLIALVLALIMMFSIATVFAYEGEIITLRASSEETFTFDPENDPMAKLILEKFGLRFEDTAYEGDTEKMRLDAMDKKLGHINYTDLLYDIPGLNEFINQGFFREIPESMLEEFPLTKARLENDAVSQAMKKAYGGYYMLPKPDSADPTIYLAERKGIFIRKDWLEKVGKEMPTTWEELYEVAKAFTLEDPDGNGVNDTYGLTGDGMGNLRFFFASTGHSNRYWVKQEDGSWKHGALMEDNIEILEWLRKMYKDGYIDPEYVSTKWEESLQKFVSGQFGMVVRNADASWIWNVLVKYYEAANPGTNPFEKITLIPALKLNANTEMHMEGYVSCMCATQISSHTTDEELKRYLTFYEYLLGEEGSMLRMGFKDVDYTVEEDGTIKKIRDSEGKPPELKVKYPSIGLTKYTSWGFELAADPKVEYFDKFNDETKALNDWACKYRNPGAVFPAIDPILLDNEAVKEANNFKINPEYWEIIKGDAPVADMFAAMVEKAMQDGYEEATKVINELAMEKGW